VFLTFFHIKGFHVLPIEMMYAHIRCHEICNHEHEVPYNYEPVMVDYLKCLFATMKHYYNNALKSYTNCQTTVLYCPLGNNLDSQFAFMHHPMKKFDFLTILLCQMLWPFAVSVEFTTLQSWKSHEKYNAVIYTNVIFYQNIEICWYNILKKEIKKCSLF